MDNIVFWIFVLLTAVIAVLKIKFNINPFEVKKAATDEMTESL